MLGICRADHFVVGAGVVPPTVVRFDVHRAQFPLPKGIFDTLSEAPLLFFLTHIEEVFEQRYAAFDEGGFKSRRQFEKAPRLLARCRSP